MTRTLVRRLAVTGTALVAGFVLTACGGDAGGHGTMPGMATGGAAPTGSAGAAFNEADVAFVGHMIVHHQQAVEMSTLAETRAGSGEVKKLSAQIKAAQAPEIETMGGWLKSWGQPAAQDMKMGHDAMPGMMSDKDMKALEGMSGTEFDKEFLKMMIAHHEGAIEMAKEETSGGASAEAKALAAQIGTTQQAEIDSMKQLLGSL
jgi:uncharacterized protein (DUF305 family)